MKYVLVVEDEEFLALALKDSLEDGGYEMSVATNGEEAVKSIEGRTPDLILLDILMPKQDGFYVLEEAQKRAEWKAIPIIVVSNLAGDAEIKRAEAMGVHDYFIKSEHPIGDVIRKVKERLKE